LFLKGRTRMVAVTSLLRASGGEHFHLQSSVGCYAHVVFGGDNLILADWLPNDLIHSNFSFFSLRSFSTFDEKLPTKKHLFRHMKCWFITNAALVWLHFSIHIFSIV
jgi:hypothetical protein